MSAYPAWYPGPTQAAFSMDTTLQPPAGPFSFYKPFSDRQLSKLPEGSRNLSSSAGFLDPSTSSAPGPCHDSLQRATAQLPSSQQQQQQQGPAPAPPGGSFQDAPAAATTLLRKDKAQQADHSGRLCEFMAQMICYIWFSDSPLTSAHSVTPSRSPTLAYAPLHSSPLSGRHGHGRGQDSQPHSAQLSQAMEEHLRKLSELASSDIKEEAETSGLRLAPQSRFRAFVRDVLNTTQVSQSVVLLAL